MTWTRRTLLGGIASATIPLSGCSLDSSADGGDDTGEFEKVQVDGRTLVVELGDLSADTVNVIAPDGTAFASRSVAQGVSKVEFDIGLSYESGEYQVVASAGESTVAKTALTIAPDLAITEVGVGENHPDWMPEALGNTKSVEALVTVINRGNGPVTIEKLLFLGELPNPTTDLEEADKDDASGIFDKEEGAGEVTQLVISGEQRDTLYSNTLPFTFQGEGIDCSSEEYTGSFRVVLSTNIEETAVTARYSIRYSSADEYDECGVSIERRE